MFDPKARTLPGKKGLVIDIANDQSIAYGCAKAFKFLGAEDLAITDLNDKAKPHVQPLAQEVEASIFIPLDVRVEGQKEAVFEEIIRRWGHLDVALPSIVFAPKTALHGRLVDWSREGFLLAMDVSCHSFIRMANLAEPLMTEGGVLFTMSYYGADKVFENRALIDENGLDRAEVEQAVAAELNRFDGVALAVPSSALESGRTADTPMTRAILRNHNPKRSGDIYVVFEPNRFISDFDGLSVASTHGSLWRYDTYVPIIFAGMNIPTQRVHSLVHTVQIAPTLSLLIGAKPPSGAYSEPLLEVMSQD